MLFRPYFAYLYPMLYPQISETRQLLDLNGNWKFKLNPRGEKLNENWATKPISDATSMPVPASYNDIGTDKNIRDHVGWVWYEREFFVTQGWRDLDLVLRFESVTHDAKVWLNGKPVMEHRGGYLPFEKDVSNLLDWEKPNRLTVAVGNILDWQSLPPGEVHSFGPPNYPEGYIKQVYWQDFFNYSGIHRPVRLLALPKTRTEVIQVGTNIRGSDGLVEYEVSITQKCDTVLVSLLDEEGREVASKRERVDGDKSIGLLSVKNARLWAPGKPYLYTLNVQVENNGTTTDVYRLPVGIRTVKVENNQFLINGEPFYFKGFGMHEDGNIRGKGEDPVLWARNFQLLHWIGANSFRTSHYPYSEEILQMADEQGIVVISETPAVGLAFQKRPVFTEGRADAELAKVHSKVLEDLVARDRNHPSVVMWSVANEPATWEEASRDYFAPLFKKVRELDSSRPVTLVTCGQPEEDYTGELVDIICVNRYFSWYTDPGETQLIERQLQHEIDLWIKRFGKPVIFTEYGADTVAGMHKLPAAMFSEEYQFTMLDHYHNVFDRNKDVIGEHIWNFADFQTKQGIVRVGGNKKGVFTREREPKMVAHFLRKRWNSSRKE